MNQLTMEHLTMVTNSGGTIWVYNFLYFTYLMKLTLYKL